MTLGEKAPRHLLPRLGQPETAIRRHIGWLRNVQSITLPPISRDAWDPDRASGVCSRWTAAASGAGQAIVARRPAGKQPLDRDDRAKRRQPVDGPVLADTERRPAGRIERELTALGDAGIGEVHRHTGQQFVDHDRLSGHNRPRPPPARL